MKNLKVIIKVPGQSPRMTVIEDCVEAIDSHVGGFSILRKIEKGMCILFSREAKNKKYPYNITISGEEYYGSVIFAGIDEEMIVDIPMEYELFQKLMPKEWWTEDTEYIQMEENKKEAVKCIEKVLEHSRYRNTIKMLELSEDERTVFIHYKNGAWQEINVAWDSVTAMMKDIAGALIRG